MSTPLYLPRSSRVLILCFYSSIASRKIGIARSVFTCARARERKRYAYVPQLIKHVLPNGQKGNADTYLGCLTNDDAIYSQL